jgi:tetratricopeptide (TPR) repeat protein
VSFWQETSRSADQAIQALAWARKGMTPDLLARVLEADIETASRWLEDIQNFSFVKLRPADKRWFLHDEMYDLLERHVLSVLPEAYREQAYRAILEWYGEQVKAQRKKVWELLIPRRSGLPDWDVTPADLPRPPGQPEKLALETDRLYNLMAEEVHYRLLLQPQEGFQTCQLYAKEAFWVNQETQETLDHLLRSELLWFLNRYSDRETFDGLPRREMEVDIALHRLERFNRGSDPQTLEYARRIRQECMDIIGEAGPLAGIWLDILEGEALLYSGIELPQAEQLLTSAVGALESFQPSSPFEEWRRSTLQAEAYNDLGYLYRTLGWFQKADEWYRKAINLWRRLEDKEEDELRRMALRAQHANTLNNRAWALAELGRFDQAIRLAEDALEMRQALGPAHPSLSARTRWG